MIKVVLLFALLFTNMAQAVSLVELKDQFNQSMQATHEIKSLLFASDMDGYKMLKEVFQEHKIEQANLTKKQMVVLADTSQMPKLIGKMFALPKMRQLKYNIILDSEGQFTQSWDKEPGRIVLFDQIQDKWVTKQSFKSKEEFSAWVKSYIALPIGQ